MPAVHAPVVQHLIEMKENVNQEVTYNDTKTNENDVCRRPMAMRLWALPLGILSCEVTL